MKGRHAEEKQNQLPHGYWQKIQQAWAHSRNFIGSRSSAGTVGTSRKETHLPPEGLVSEWPEQGHSLLWNTISLPCWWMFKWQGRGAPRRQLSVLGRSAEMCLCVFLRGSCHLGWRSMGSAETPLALRLNKGIKTELPRSQLDNQRLLLGAQQSLVICEVRLSHSLLGKKSVRDLYISVTSAQLLLLLFSLGFIGSAF